MIGRLLSLVVVGLALSACQMAMSVEEAKKVTAQFASGAFVPPPRTIEDITALLDREKLADPAALANAKALVDQMLPNTTDPQSLAAFYYQRGIAAGEVGRTKQEIEDLTKAAHWAARGGSAEHEILFWLSIAEMLGGNYSRAIQRMQGAVSKVPASQRGFLVSMNTNLVRFHAAYGEIEAANAALREAEQVTAEATRWTGMRPDYYARFAAQTAAARGAIFEAQGDLVNAERFYRSAVAARAHLAESKDHWVEVEMAQLVRVLADRGLLMEAEQEARAALLLTLRKRGRDSTSTASRLRGLVEVIFEQGRYAEAESLARAAVAIYTRTGSSPDSLLMAYARTVLGDTLGAQGRWRDALAEYEAVRLNMAGDQIFYKTRLVRNPGWALALLNTGQMDQALEILQTAFEQGKRVFGESHPKTGEIRGILAIAHARKGERGLALQEFADATRALLATSHVRDGENTSQPARDQRLVWILSAYIGLLADIKGTPLERQAGMDVAAEAFRLADIARARSVQRSLNASAARAAAKTPALADLIRQEQDAVHRVNALYGALANQLAQPTDQQDAKLTASLRSQIVELRRAQQALANHIQKEFPAYAELINPRATTVDAARANLRPGEALIATYTAQDRTFVWAVSRSGEILFAAVPASEREIAASVATLRKALDPSAMTLGEIPVFDLAAAHRLFKALLEPVAPAWQRAESLLVVAHGPLAQIPFSLLPTKPATLGPETGGLFSSYRAVPWLARTHAVTVLPSVTALTTLRALPPGDPNRRPFAGFGDPYFSEEQARRAAAGPAPEQVTALASRGVPITLRNLKVEKLNSNKLAILPRLPETADEIKDVAAAMRADMSRDVFLGERANEQQVKSMDLSGYRVLAFATHGLVPGDLDGLTQPALALTAPEVAKIQGDGLLTMEEILALRLNADWVVLSACNTASGQGAGAEAISGLGRAFFYAGARALLVTNWPVETNSARALTTDLFRRQSKNARVSRAKALQETMNTLIDGSGFVDPRTNQVVFSYAHPIFWAPFTLVGDGGGPIR